MTQKWLVRMRLGDSRNIFPDRMTLDEVRRLDIAMAMADSPKVLLLDEVCEIVLIYSWGNECNRTELRNTN